MSLFCAGPGESGKSTVFKQMKIISTMGGFSQEELQAYRYVVYGNCITQMKVLLNAVRKLEYDFDSNNNEVRQLQRILFLLRCINILDQRKMDTNGKER